MAATKLARFVVNPTYLLAHTIFYYNSPCQSGDGNRLKQIGLERICADNNRMQFRFLTEMLSEALPPEAQAIADELMGTGEFKRILKRVEKHKDFLAETWEAAYDKTLEMMTNIIGMGFEGDVFTIYVTLREDGRYFGERRITWGTQKPRYPNSPVIDLWHEIMHGKIKQNGRDLGQCNGIEHAVIQLAVDNEMRVRLNGGSYPPFVAHDEHKYIMEHMLPHWKEYLASQQRNIADFYHSMERLRKALTA